MAYNFNFDVSAQISAKTVEDMIKKVVEEQTGKKAARVELKMRSVTKGMGPSEHTETIFDGATVYFENEKVETIFNGNKSFKKDTYE